jgi:hypothetical protein
MEEIKISSFSTKTFKWKKEETGYWEKFGYPSDGSIPGLKC